MNEPIKNSICGFTKGDTSGLEMFFNQPGGRKYLENLSLILIHTLPHDYSEKEKLYLDFVMVLDGLHQQVRQKQGQTILDDVFNMK